MIFTSLFMILFSANAVCSMCSDGTFAWSWNGIDKAGFKKTFHTKDSEDVLITLGATSRFNAFCLLEKGSGNDKVRMQIGMGSVPGHGRTETFLSNPSLNGGEFFTATITSNIESSNQQEGCITFTPPHGKPYKSMANISSNDPRPIVCLCKLTQTTADVMHFIFAGRHGEGVFVRSVVEYDNLSQAKVSWGHALYNGKVQSETPKSIFSFK